MNMIAGSKVKETDLRDAELVTAKLIITSYYGDENIVPNKI